MQWKLWDQAILGTGSKDDHFLRLGRAVFVPENKWGFKSYAAELILSTISFDVLSRRLETFLNRRNPLTLEGRESGFFVVFWLFFRGYVALTLISVFKFPP